MAFTVCILDGDETRMHVSGPPRKLAPKLDEWERQQVRNAIKGAGYELGKPELMSEDLVVRFSEPPVRPEPTRAPRRRQPVWDNPGGRCLDCRCATASWDGHGKLTGCASGCDGSCMICVRCGTTP